MGNNRPSKRKGTTDYNGLNEESLREVGGGQRGECRRETNQGERGLVNHILPPLFVVWPAPSPPCRVQAHVIDNVEG